jgi:hypothetical protein
MLGRIRPNLRRLTWQRYQPCNLSWYVSKATPAYSWIILYSTKCCLSMCARMHVPVGQKMQAWHGYVLGSCRLRLGGSCDL